MNNMANLDRIINAQISLNTTGISSAGFSTLMIVGPHANSLSRVLTITDVDELMDMGFTSTDAIRRRVMHLRRPLVQV